MLPDDKLRDEPSRLAALERYKIAGTLPEKRFDSITNIVKKVLDVPMVAVTFISSERHYIKSGIGLAPCDSPRDLAFCNHAIKSRKPMVVPDTKADPRFADNPMVANSVGDGLHVGSYAGVPLETPEGYNIGALCIMDTVPREFTEEQMDMLSSFGSLVMSELELRLTARMDELTGVLTRRSFISEVDELISSWERQKHVASSHSLVMIDIDGMKDINEKYGRDAGDRTLKEVAAFFSSIMRSADTLGRVGGQQFAIIMPNTREDDAMKGAERFRSRLSELMINLDVPARVTASLGVSEVDADCGTAERWMDKSSMGIDAAKGDGGDTCRATAITQ